MVWGLRESVWVSWLVFPRVPQHTANGIAALDVTATVLQHFMSALFIEWESSFQNTGSSSLLLSTSPPWRLSTRLTGHGNWEWNSESLSEQYALLAAEPSL